MNEGDLGFVVACTTAEGWLGETESVFRGFLQYDPEGCLIGEEDGCPVGMCVAVSYGECGFLGELIVVAEHRGQGRGRRLLEHAVTHLRSRGGRSIYLDGDTPAVPLYERLGFRTICRSKRFLGTLPGKQHPHVRPMTTTDLDALLVMDRRAFGADRSFFLEERLRHFPEACWTMWAAERRTGFLMGQPGHGVVSVGPWLVTPDTDRPLDLLEALAHGAGSARLRVGVLESSAAACGHLASLGTFAETEPSWRMVLGPDVGLGARPELYAIGSAAKG